MLLLDAVPITSCHECVATLTLPLALFLILAETTVGGVATVAYLRLAGGLTLGFLKFIAVTYAILGILAFLVVLGAPPGSYHRLLAINQPAANALVVVMGLVVLALVVNAVVTWRGSGSSTASSAVTLIASVILLAGGPPLLLSLGALGSVVLPLVAAGLALATCRLRSFMSTTGLLYLAMIAILPGQLLGQLLFFGAASA